MQEKRLRMLVVEDDQNDFVLLQNHIALLDTLRLEITRASSYEIAIAIIGSQRHDLYFLDYRLGRYDGIQLIHEIRRLGHYAPIVLMTGAAGVDIGAVALLAGATDFVPKNELHGPLLERTIRYAFIRQSVEEQLRTRANTDGLTKAMSREQFLDMARRELLRAQRFGHQTTLLIADIDQFKSVNDTHGHHCGDHVLVTTVSLFRNLLRSTDIVGRFGGDEFMVLMPETGLTAGGLIAERIRTEVERMQLRYNDADIEITVSIGLATADPQPTALFDLIETADRGLFSAKRAGRNRVGTGVKAVSA